MFTNKLLVLGTWVLSVALPGAAGMLTGQAELPAQADAAPPLLPSATGHVDRYGDPLPAGAIVRLGTVRYRFQNHGLAFLPDGQTVVSAKHGGAIQLWDVRTGRLLREIDRGQFQVGHSGLSLSRDGRRLAVAGSLTEADGSGWRSAVRVFDIASGKELRTFEAAVRQGFNSVVLAPDGEILLTLNRDGILRVQEVTTGAELLQHTFPGDVMAHLALSVDGSMLALASGPNTHKILVWKWQTPEEPREFKSGDRCSRVTFSPDGKLLAACDDADPTVRVWKVPSGRLLHKLELPDLARYWYFDVAFAPDGKTLAASGQTNERSAVHLWEASSGKFLRRLEGGGSRLAFSPNGQLLVCGLQVWDLAAGKELSGNDEAHRGPIERLVTGANGLVVTASFGKSIRIWNAATGQQLRQLTQEGWIRAVALSPDGSKVVSSSLGDDAVCVWEVATGRQIYKLPGHGRSGGGGALVFTPDGKSFLSWGDDMYLRQWDMRTGKAVFEYAIRPTGVRVFTEDDDSMERERAMMSPDGIRGGVFTPDARQLVVKAGKMFVFETASGKELWNFPMESRFIISQAISPDGRSLLTSDSGKSVQTKLPDGTIQRTTAMNHPVTLYELATGGVRKQLTLPEQGAGPVAFSADGKWFAAASSRPGEHIRVWDASGQEVWSVEGFPGPVRSLAFMPDGKRLVAGLEDSSALIWDLTQKRR
jgi:WD40 repeat protein